MSHSLQKIINDLIESGEFLKISNPIRYMGEEYGAVDVTKKIDVNLKVAICFPDTYEIGMSNMAIKILYEILNEREKTVAERVFLPYPDAIEFFKNKDIPLYSLESKTPIKDFDLLIISVSSELLYTNILKILEISHIPIYKKNRDNNHPLVIVGGPAVTNPLPLEPFVDFVCIGEFEAAQEPYIKAEEKIFQKDQLINLFEKSPYYWRKNKKVHRAVVSHLPIRSYKYFPVSSIRLSQDHGSIEIMRGCPNGCRFCHAGIFYRPYREKSITQIIDEIDQLVFQFGYRDISLSSLSSGDYSQIYQLMTILDHRYKDEHISFALPSIKVNSFTLDLLEPLSGIKKSGLTLAIETPGDDGQLSINKNVSKEKLYQIIDAAKSRGWNLIKLYFMIGLPYYIDNPDKEKKLIIDLIQDISDYFGKSINVNIGTFIPKPHTPFQYSPQLSYDIAKNNLQEIKSYFYKNKKIKISYHEPYVSFIESILSKGNEDSAKILEEAYHQGAYLDAWNEYFNREAWEKSLSQFPVEIQTILETDENTFPWKDISLNISPNFLKDEYKRSLQPSLTSVCDETCSHLCGSCNSQTKVRRTNDCSINPKPQSFPLASSSKTYLLKMSRKSTASYLSQKNIIPFMERIFYRAGLRLQFTEGFNRKPKMEFANPLPVGISSEADYLKISLYNDEAPEVLLKRLQQASISSLKFLLLQPIDIPYQTHLPSLMSLYYSSDFLIESLGEEASWRSFLNSVKQFQEEGFIKILSLNDFSLLLNIKEISIRKAISILDDFSLRITRIETYYLHLKNQKIYPFSEYFNYFKIN